MTAETPHKTLKSTTALQRYGNFNARVLDALINGNPAHEETVIGVVKKTPGAEADARWEQIKKSRASLGVDELADILQAMEAKGQGISAHKIENEKRPSALSNPAFYDALAKAALNGEKIKKQLEDLRAEGLKTQGYVAKAFSVFSAKDPVGKAMSSVQELEKYAYKNGIKFDGKTGALAQGDKPRSLGEKLWDNRFLLSAAGGAALGFAGVNLGLVPLLSATPAIFFGVLPWLAAPFIGLNIFKSFSQYSIIKESPTLLRFAAITAAGLAISAGVTALMTHLLPVVNPASIAAANIPGFGGGGFSPMQYMLPIIGVFTGAALMYKRAKAVLTGEDKPKTEDANKPERFKTLKSAYNKAVGLVMNKHTAPAVAAIGKAGEKATDVVNNVFPKFIDAAGIPAIATLLSATMATGGLGLLGAFAGYYITAFTGMAVGGAAILGAYYKFGARGKDFKEIFRAAAAGFSISSSSATMPLEKEVLAKMGVSKKTRDTVVPLGGVFNMYGTSLYMGLTAFYSLSMFGASPTPMQYVNTASTVMAIALGAPGIPASNITLLDPVLRQTGLATPQINKVYSMILPADRILDMVQTALNVLGDMIAAVHPDRKRMRYARAKNIKKIREERLKKEKLALEQQPVKEQAELPAAAPVVTAQAAINDNKKDVLTPVVETPAVPAPAKKINPPTL